MSIYRVRLGEKAEIAAEAFSRGFIGVGFSFELDLSGYPPEREAFIRQLLPEHRKANPEATERKSRYACGVMWRMVHEMQKEDAVISCGTDGHFRLGQIVGKYGYEPGKDLPHRRKVEWHETTIPLDELSGALKSSVLDRHTIVEVTQHREEIFGWTTGVFAPALEPVMCVICWNGNGWGIPWKNRRKETKHPSFLEKHGFGHEEWLNRSEWLLEDFRYAHLEGLQGKSPGSAFDVLLYSQPEPGKGNWFLVGRIRGAVRLDRQEALWAKSAYEENGWLEQMRREVENIGADQHGLPPYGGRGVAIGMKNGDFDVANIKYAPDTIEIYPEPQPRPKPSGACYHGAAYPWPEGENPPPPAARKTPEARRAPYSEKDVLRKAAKEAVITQWQNRIQNRMLNDLRARGERVKPEQHVDSLKKRRADLCVFRKAGKVEKRIFIEIKCMDTARESIRLALGQLLEYTHYPDKSPHAVSLAEKMVIVGHRYENEKDKAYIRFLGRHYGVNMEYYCFDWKWGKETYDRLLKLQRLPNGRDENG